MFFVLKAAFRRDSLNQLWNELVKDGEILTREENYGLLNSAGIIARKGQFDNVFKCTISLDTKFLMKQCIFHT